MVFLKVFPQNVPFGGTELPGFHGEGPVLPMFHALIQYCNIITYKHTYTSMHRKRAGQELFDEIIILQKTEIC